MSLHKGESPLRQAIQDLKQCSDFLQYKLHNVQQALEMQTFSLDKLPIRVADNSHTTHVRTLLTILGLEESGLTVGIFLKALNTWLIQQGHVDYNDLLIRVTTPLSLAFQIPLDISKIPYPVLLKQLGLMFI